MPSAGGGEFFNQFQMRVGRSRNQHAVDRLISGNRINVVGNRERKAHREGLALEPGRACVACITMAQHLVAGRVGAGQGRHPNVAPGPVFLRLAVGVAPVHGLAVARLVLRQAPAAAPRPTLRTPRGFLRRLAGAVAISPDDLFAWLSPPPAPALARSYRADAQPTVATQVSFEHVLVDAGVAEDDRARLLADVD